MEEKLFGACPARFSMMKRVVMNAFVGLGSLVVLLGALELLCRVSPPTGIYHSGSIYDPNTGFRYAPHSEVIYNKLGPILRHRTNGYGFLDMEHQIRKPDNVLRIGFFGDSYVEALQVPLEHRFFRQLPSQLPGRKLEYLAFGISGLGTVHSYLNSLAWTKVFDLDLIVYVFVENDPLDNHGWSKKTPDRPYAVPTDAVPRFRVTNTWEYYQSRARFPWNIPRELLGRSILAQVVLQRTELWRNAWGQPASIHETAHAHNSVENSLTVQRRNDETVGIGDGRAEPQAPQADDLPGKWNSTTRLYAQETTAAILEEWSWRMKEQGKQVVVLYLPRGPDFLAANERTAQTWKDWLITTCRELNIELLDPSPAFLEKQRKGDPIYQDHLTTEGHNALREWLHHWLERKIE